MRCPFCGKEDTQVRDSRASDDGATIRRRRLCSSCGSRFTTFERIQLRDLSVIKRNGKKIPFELDEKWMLEKEKITNCEVTGILFSDSPGPFARSFDQRSPGKGYTPENVDVVVRIYNYAKNVYDIEDVESFCRQYVTHMEQR